MTGTTTTKHLSCCSVDAMLVGTKASQIQEEKLMTGNKTTRTALRVTAAWHWQGSLSLGTVDTAVAFTEACLSH